VKVRAHVFVGGRVQGVFFRAQAMERAIRLGISGWVRNLPDGYVEAVFEGEEEPVKLMVEFCRKGPPSAVVTDFNVDWEPFKGEFGNFKVRHTSNT
jgi:acylphosphatase